MRKMHPLMCVAIAGCFAASGVHAATLFDSTSSTVNVSNSVVEPGTMGGVGVSLALSPNPFNPSDPPTYLGNFGTVDFSLPGGASGLNLTADENNGFFDVTAKALPGNTGDAVVRAGFIEVNPPVPDDNNPGGTVVLREVYLYDFSAGDFSDTEFTTLTRPVQDFSQMTLLADVFDTDGSTIGLGFFAGVFFPGDGSGFQPNGDVNLINQAAFQTPTSDGSDDGDNTGPVLLEVLSLSVRPVPEPGAALLAALGGLGLMGGRRRSA